MNLFKNYEYQRYFKAIFKTIFYETKKSNCKVKMNCTFVTIKKKWQEQCILQSFVIGGDLRMVQFREPISSCFENR